jgi:hypothetical protein
MAKYKVKQCELSSETRLQPAGTVKNVLSKVQDSNSKLTKPIGVLIDFLQNMIAVGTWQLLTTEIF